MESDAMTEASFVMLWNIAHAKHWCSYCKIAKKNVAEVVAALKPNSKRLQWLLEKNYFHVKLRKFEISTDVEVTVQNDL